METPGDPSLSQIQRAVARILNDGGVAALATIVVVPDNPNLVGIKLLIESNETYTGTTRDPVFDRLLADHARLFLSSRTEARTVRADEFASELPAWAGARILLERVEPEPHVVVCGAGHVGASLARLATSIGYRVTLIDDRAGFVARERFPDGSIHLVAALDWSDSVKDAIGTGRGVSVAVVTRGHNEDEECLRAVLQTRPDYVGMIGSKRRTNIVLARLRETGVAEDLLRDVRAPIGLDIAAVTPEEVALAILAEIVAHRRGGAGQSLSSWRR